MIKIDSKGEILVAFPAQAAIADTTCPLFNHGSSHGDPNEILILITFLLTGLGMILLVFLVTCIHSHLPYEYCEGI